MATKKVFLGKRREAPSFFFVVAKSSLDFFFFILAKRGRSADFFFRNGREAAKFFKAPFFNYFLFFVVS